MSNTVNGTETTEQPGMLSMLILPDRHVQLQITDGDQILHTMNFSAEDASNLALAILRGLLTPGAPASPAPEGRLFDA